MNTSEYPPIADYGFIADCHSSALVSMSGSIDWCCLPRTDSSSCFGRLLDRGKGGYCRIAPDGDFEVSRRYIPNSLILETTFRTAAGECRLIDFFAMRAGGRHRPYRQILRIAEGISGLTELAVIISPRFDYGAIKPWIRRYGERHYSALGGSDGLLISGSLDLEIRQRHDLHGLISLKKDERAYLSLLYERPEVLDERLVEVPGIGELDRRLEETTAWWNGWSSKCTLTGPYADHARRSSVILKGLSNALTGAIAAAATTSLPEVPGGTRNWDYRFTWVRDSCFAVRSLAELGHVKEADWFRRFIERSAAGSADEIQVLFGLGGERRLHEYEPGGLEGYRSTRPVRVGNAASAQRQLDIYGELLDLAWRWHSRGFAPDHDYWDFLVELTNAASRLWKEPDRGIWEMRGRPRHFVHSKVMCWAAMDRAIRMAEELGRRAPVARWKAVRDEIRRAVDEKGCDARRGFFIQAFDRPQMDAALLLLPTVGFVEYGDERMIRTVDEIRRRLEEDGLLRRYAPGSDGMEGTEGVFLSCSFWLAECLACQGRRAEAKEVFRRAAATGNDLGLFSEEYGTRNKTMLGNFPQGLTHLSLIAAAVAISGSDQTSPADSH